jgi:hypothetical protein
VWVLASGLLLAAVGVVFVLVGLDKADKIASSAGFFVGLAGLGVSVYGVILARGATPPPPAREPASASPALREVTASWERSVSVAGDSSAPIVTGDNNEVRGEVGGHVVQAAAIHGGVHFHSSGDSPPDGPPIIASVTSNFRIDSRRGMPAVDKIGVLVEARSAQAVILHKFQPVIMARSTPPSSHTPFGKECVAMAIRELQVFLDDDPPTLIVESGPGFPFTVTASDPEFFFLEVFSSFSEVEWRLEIFWTHAGRQGRTTVDQNGHPFRHVAEGDPSPDGQVHERLRKFLRAVPCPTCGRRPESDREYCLHVQQLADTWLHPDPDNPRQVIGRRHCFGCEPVQRGTLVVRCKVIIPVFTEAELAYRRAVGQPDRYVTSCPETVHITAPLFSRNGPDERALHWLYNNGWRGEYPYDLTCKLHASGGDLRLR